MTPAEKLREALDELAALTPAGIARLLHSEGVKGWPRSICGCPLAVYLARRCGAPVTVEGDLIWLPRDDAEFDTPDNVQRFIRTFDGGLRYRFLIDEAVA